MAGQTVEVALGNPGSTASFTIPPHLVPYVDSVFARIDNSAGSDTTPTLEVQAPNGDTVAAVPQNEVVPGGDTGRVTWAARIVGKSGGSATGLRAQFGYTVIGQVINDTTVTPISIDAGSFFDSTSSPFTGSGASPPVINGVSAWRASFALSVLWPAGAYARYIEFVDSNFFTSGNPATWRNSDASGDYQTLSGLALGNPSSPQPIVFNAFQTSGAPVTIQRWIIAYALPLKDPA